MQSTIKIRYNQFMGYFMFISSLFILFTSLVIGPSISLLTGIILLVVSRQYLKQAAIVILPKEIQEKNLFGGIIKSYPYTNLIVENGNIYADTVKLRFPTWMLHEADLKYV